MCHYIFHPAFVAVPLTLYLFSATMLPSSRRCSYTLQVWLCVVYAGSHSICSWPTTVANNVRQANMGDLGLRICPSECSATALFVHCSCCAISALLLLHSIIVLPHAAVELTADARLSSLIRRFLIRQKIFLPSLPNDSVGRVRSKQVKRARCPSISTSNMLLLVIAAFASFASNTIAHLVNGVDIYHLPACAVSSDLQK